MARKGRMCVVEGCGRRAERGSVVCGDHRETALGEQTDREIATLARRLTALAKLESTEERREAARVFRQQVARGDYATLFASRMVQMLEEAGAENSLRREMGMLRMGMMRVMLEEEDPSRMAHALAKLANALGRSMQLQETREAERAKLGRHAVWFEAYGVAREEAARQREAAKQAATQPATYAPATWSPGPVGYGAEEPEDWEM